MKMKRNEKGQVLILVVVSAVVLAAMAALIIDGGNAYLNRRGAQTAADSGAVAGASIYFLSPSRI